MVTAGSLFSLEFNVSPNDDGTMDVFAGLDWEYNLEGMPSGFYSSVEAKYSNTQSNDESDTQYIATSGSVLSFGVDILGYRMRNKNLRFDIALNTQFENMDIREIGYMDIETTRYFILNDRIIQLVLPRIKGKLLATEGPLQFTLGCEYSPWLSVSLDQELTISPVLEKTLFDSSQSATNAFSVNTKLRYSNPVITPQIFLEYDYLSIVYDFLDFSGVGATADQEIKTLTLEGMLVFSAVELNGIHPAIVFSYTWDWTTATINNGSPDSLDDTDFSIGFGFEF